MKLTFLFYGCIFATFNLAKIIQSDWIFQIKCNKISTIVEFSANLKHFRKLKGLTQAQLAQELALTNTSVSNWEQGLATPDLLTALKLSKFFGISVNDLFIVNLRDTNMVINDPVLDYKKPPGVCDLCAQKDDTISALNRLAQTQSKTIELLDARVRELENQSGQKRKAV